MTKNPPPAPGESAPPTGEIVLYQREDGRTRVECRFVDGTLWLTQALIAELFQKDVQTVIEHLQNIYSDPAESSHPADAGADQDVRRPRD